MTALAQSPFLHLSDVGRAGGVGMVTFRCVLIQLSGRQTSTAISGEASRALSAPTSCSGSTRRGRGFLLNKMVSPSCTTGAGSTLLVGFSHSRRCHLGWRHKTTPGGRNTTSFKTLTPKSAGFSPKHAFEEFRVRNRLKLAAQLLKLEVFD